MVTTDHGQKAARRLRVAREENASIGDHVTCEPPRESRSRRVVDLVFIAEGFASLFVHSVASGSCRRVAAPALHLRRRGRLQCSTRPVDVP